jgi:hypothetical protein
MGDCGVAGAIHTVPSVPGGIAAPAGVVLVAGYRAVGNQIYTCTATSDAGADGGNAGTWVNTATATLYGDNCAIAAQHSFAPGPTWAGTDGSTVSAAKLSAVAAPVPDGGDGGVTAIAWLLLKANSNSGEGQFTNVTYVHRLDTQGGVGPSGACDPLSDAGTVVKVPYTATYYFYTGGISDSGTEAGTDADDGG